MNMLNKPTHFEELFDKRPADGVFRVDRAVYTSPEIFEEEIANIFEGSWVYVTHEDLLPNPFDWVTGWIGRQSIIVQRNQAGEIQAFRNACPHRGATLCRTERGNKKHHVCGYHGWTFDSNGKNLWIQRLDEGYSTSISEYSMDLVKVAKVESYRGFVFASLNSDVPSLTEYLGSATVFLDMLIDQSPDGITLLKGRSTCVFHGNWKLMLENGGGDGLHPDYAHKSLLGVSQRKNERSHNIRTMQIDNMHKKRGGQWTFGNGHTAMWFSFPNPEDRPVYAELPRLRERFGESRAQWMTSMFRNLSIFPNLHVLDQMATLIRVFRPLAVDKTEITFYCVAPKNEPKERRIHRLRQFEEFFMGSGMGTPDDNAEFEECQTGSNGKSTTHSFISFGLHNKIEGIDETAASLGIKTESSGLIGYEGCSMSQFDQWIRLMNKQVISAGGVA
jgi:Phenylpropionate dioxygenase and related ring-hydroxylating dioxygenases, large terminal subunit